LEPRPPARQPATKHAFTTGDQPPTTRPAKHPDQSKITKR
jgi:hypothetical protein